MEPRKRASQQRTPPRSMPTQAPRPDKSALHGKEKPRDVLPAQKPVTDDEVTVKAPSRLRVVLVRAACVLLLVVALVVIYLFLLIGEPDEENKYLPQVTQERITMPMVAVESPGESNVQSLADTFGQPVMCLYTGFQMQRARVFDTAFGGGYARRVSLSYALPDGQSLLVESIRPTEAITLLSTGSYTLNAASLYAIGGLDAARMENSESIVVFARSDTAAYAVTMPASHAGELGSILRQTMLVSPAGSQ